MRRAVASILQAFLRTDRDISLRPWGRRCLADHHLRTWCPPNKPPRVSSGLGKPGSDRKSTRLNSSHSQISYAVFCLKKKKKIPVSTVVKKRAFISSKSNQYKPTATKAMPPLLNQDHHKASFMC